MRTVQVRLVHNLRLDDLLDDVLQRDDAHHFIEGIALPFAVHPLHHGQVRFPCRHKEYERVADYERVSMSGLTGVCVCVYVWL